MIFIKNLILIVMITKLNYDMLFYALKFLPNHEIMNMFIICKELNKILNKEVMLEYMSYRDHPIVFNQNDNYCMKCNQGIIIFNDEDKSDELKYIICNHS
tara:strand:+ start:6814 stop:7113 length:300 start_codon:yes stop_codon:yes gene_type:complete